MEKQYIKMPDGWIRVQDYEECMSIENEPQSLYQNNQYHIQKRKQAILGAQTTRFEDMSALSAKAQLDKEAMTHMKKENNKINVLEQEEKMNKFALWSAGLVMIVLLALMLFAHFVIWVTPGLSWDLVVQNLVFGMLQGLYYLFKCFYWLCESAFNYIVIDLLGFQF